jgi:hypothetical protein
VIDNQTGGHSLNVTAQLRRSFGTTVQSMLAYNFTEATNALKSTEIASVLWQNQPIQGNPNRPGVSFSEFGQRHRIVGMATLGRDMCGRSGPSMWPTATFAGGRQPYSFISGDERRRPGRQRPDLCGGGRYPLEDTSPAARWSPPTSRNRLDAFIEQDDYLRAPADHPAAP